MAFGLAGFNGDCGVTKLQNMYDVVRDKNSCIKEVLDAAVELNAWAQAARNDGWEVVFHVDEVGDVNISIGNTEWPVREVIEQ